MERAEGDETMGMKTKIDWCDASWNPVTGCNHECPYCYARGIANRFGGADALEIKDVSENSMGDGLWELDAPMHKRNGQIAPYPFGFAPTIHRYKLDEPQRWKKPRTIFVCSMADLFGDWVPLEWIRDVFMACAQAPQHRYLFLTKNPKRLLSLAHAGMLPTGDHYWFGSSATTPETPFYYNYNKNMSSFVSIEPILKPFDSGTFIGVDWVIVGAETGNRKGKVIPEKGWITDIIRQCQDNSVPIFMKESLRSLMGDDFRQEFPWEVKS